MPSPARVRQFVLHIPTLWPPIRSCLEVPMRSTSATLLVAGALGLATYHYGSTQLRDEEQGHLGERGPRDPRQID